LEFISSAVTVNTFNCIIQAVGIILMNVMSQTLIDNCVVYCTDSVWFADHYRWEGRSGYWMLAAASIHLQSLMSFSP